jgi:tetratricopeptide (TPR) repeat protein
LNDFQNDYPQNYGALVQSKRFQAASYESDKDPEVFEMACSLSMLRPEPCSSWVRRIEASGHIEAATAIEKSQLIDRFHGSPKRTELLIASYTNRGDIDRAASLATEEVKQRPRDWNAYRSLGNLYMRAGRFKEAANSFLTYPLFKNPPLENTVGISVDAEISANALAKRGAVAEAKPLYEIAARQRNGSAASLQAQAFLASQDRRFEDAEAAAREKLERYGDGASMRAYLALLFIRGDSKNAWAGVRDGIARSTDIAPWRAVPIGLRLEGTDVSSAKTWLLENTKVGPSQPQYAKNLANLRGTTMIVQALATDRDVATTSALPEFVNEVFPVSQPVAPNFGTIPEDGTPEVREAVRQAIEAGKARYAESLKHFAAESPTWAAYLRRFVAGYSALKRADYKSAWDAFQKDRYPSNYMGVFEPSIAGLPYHAFAAIKAGKAEEFAQFTKETSKEVAPTSERRFKSPAYPEFERHLARAVLEMSAGNHASAKQELLLARGTFPDVGDAVRPLVPEYVFAEICEFLSAESGVTDYIDIAVAWAKAWQQYDPSSAWAYAFEAKYGKDEPSRIRAAAIASYLNRYSARVADVPANIAVKAKAWIESNKPFSGTRLAGKPGTKS